MSDQAPAPVSANPVPIKPVAFEDFFTRDKANEGIELPLFTPDGKVTEHHIKIRGVDSDAYHAARLVARRKMAEIWASADRAGAAAKIDPEAEEIEMLVCLVISWTFDRPCTPENIRELLRKAPQLRQEIDNLSTRRELFFKKGLGNSTVSQNQSSP